MKTTDGPAWNRYEVAPGVACLTCGAETVGVKAHAVGFDYCRNCFYTGIAAEDRRADQLNEMREALPGWTVGVEHTGGGCFWLAFYPPNHDPERHTYYTATDGEAALPTIHPDDDSPEVPIRDGWGYVGRYFYSVDADEENEHPDGIEGTTILEPTVPLAMETKTHTHAVTGEEVTYQTYSCDYWNDYPAHCLTDAQIVECIRADWESRSA